MPPVKKVAIEVYVPAGKYCEGYTYTCPLLQDGQAGVYCVIIPDAFWLLHPDWIQKHPDCPSLLKKANKLSKQDLINHRLRIIKKAGKEGRLEELITDEDGDI